MRLFSYLNDDEEEDYIIENIHNERGYKMIRRQLSEQYSIGNRLPDIQVTGVLFENRECFLTHFTNDDILLDDEQTYSVLEYFESLWGFPVILQSRDRSTNNLLAEYP
jgi:spore cortex formation protein SpoVR/YcgB (stage V sporulation)